MPQAGLDAVRRAVLLVTLCLAPLAGCVAQAGHPQESLIENVAPLPESPPGVELRWLTRDAITLSPGQCATMHWSLAARHLPRASDVVLDLQATHGLDARLVARLAPNATRVSGDEVVLGNATVCAEDRAPDGAGELAILAFHRNATVAADTARLVVQRS